MVTEEKIIVAVAGGFDPFHQGHLEHIKKASKLGNLLLIFVSNDDDMIRKKGRCNIPMAWRMEIVRLIVRGLGIDSRVIPTIDKDGTQADTLRMYRPKIFAKGGDRTPENMPANEIEVCKEIGCEIIYGVGQQLNSSSKMVR